MNGENVTKYKSQLAFKISGKLFTLRSDVFKTFTDCQFKTTDSPDAKLKIDFADEIRFDTLARGKSLRGRNLRKNYFNNAALLAFELKISETTNFFSQNLNELCDRSSLIIQEKQAGKDTSRFDSEVFAMFHK